MIFSNTIAELAKSLSDAQAELKNPYNTADNAYFKSKYAPLPDILNSVRPVLTRHGISIIQRPATDESGNTGVETMLLHKSGQYILFEPYFLKPAKTDPQTAGGAITYARRYALNAALGISGEEDDDGNSASSKGNKAPAPAQKILCPKCGKPVSGIRTNGKGVTASEVFERLGMCHKCYKECNSHVEGQNAAPALPE